MSAADALAAADNNARWCDVVCRSHGLATRFVDNLWIAPEGSPPLYPDVVTLAPRADVLRHLPPAAGGVKDSFARLDLAPEGFRVLFDASWIVHRSPRLAAPELRWAAVGDAGELEEWTEAAGLEGIIRAELLADHTVRILAAWDDEIVAGAIANSTGSVVGVSNVFGEQPQLVWEDLQGVVSSAFPNRPIVGYEHGDALADALASGFSEIQPLRIWVRETA